MTHWQPIESAPTDGTPILVTVAGGAYHASKAHWDERWRTWAVTDAPSYKLEMTPTHWMRLPEPPISTEFDQYQLGDVA